MNEDETATTTYNYLFEGLRFLLNEEHDLLVFLDEHSERETVVTLGSKLETRLMALFLSKHHCSYDEALATSGLPDVQAVRFVLQELQLRIEGVQLHISGTVLRLFAESQETDDAIDSRS